MGNTATSDLVVVTNNNSTAFTNDDDCGSLAAGASCHLTYQFVPTTGGEQTASPTGTVDGQPFSLSLAGNALDPGTLSARQFLITPTSLDFGDVPLNNSSAPQFVTVTNVSGASQTMDGTDGGSTIFTGSNNCQGATLLRCLVSHDLPVQTDLARCNTTASTDMGNWNGEPFTIHFSGTGINQFLISPIGFDFGDVVVGTTSTTQSVVVKNVGSATADVFAGGAGLGTPWGISGACKNAMLATGETCTEDFFFAPTTTGPQTTSSDGSMNGQAFSAALAGNGVTAPPPPAGPAVTSITPSSGPTAGGTSVTITGTGFTGATTVRFGSVAAMFALKSSTKIVAVAPAQSAGTRDITVKTPGGTSAAVTADRFTYVAAPKVTAISPSSGPTAGGTSVTITGTGFTGATTVRFGSVAATFALKSSTKIVAVAPAQSAGTRDISVKTPGGTSAAVTADRFTYVAASEGDGNLPVVRSEGWRYLGDDHGYWVHRCDDGAVRFGGCDIRAEVEHEDRRGGAGAVRGTRDISVKTPGGVSATVTCRPVHLPLTRRDQLLRIYCPPATYGSVPQINFAVRVCGDVSPRLRTHARTRSCSRWTVA